MARRDHGSTAVKVVTAILMAGLAAMFVTSVIYRVQNPGRVVQGRSAMSGMPGSGGMPPQAGMQEMSDLMNQLKEQPDNLDLNLDIARRFMRMGAWTQAEVFLNSARQLAPDDSRVLTLSAMAHFEAGQHEQALAEYQKLLAAEPDNAMYHFNVGILLKHYLNDPQGGADHFREAIRLDPDNQRLKELAEKELAAEHGQSGTDGTGQ